MTFADVQKCATRAKALELTKAVLVIDKQGYARQFGITIADPHDTDTFKLFLDAAEAMDHMRILVN